MTSSGTRDRVPAREEARDSFMTTDKPWTDATLRVDIGYDSSVFDLDQLQAAVEDKLRELPVEVFRLQIEDEA